MQYSKIKPITIDLKQLKPPKTNYWGKKDIGAHEESAKEIF